VARVSLRKKQYKVNQISDGWNLLFSLLMIVLAFCTVMPIILMVVISFSSAESIALNGYKYIPSEWSLEAYKAIAKMGSSFGRSYLMTIFYTAVGTVLGLIVMSMFAYVLARKDFVYRRQLSFWIFFTTLFSGGLVPSYILNTRYLHINDTIWIFILPTLVSAFDIIILRTFVQTTIPDALFDSAKIDGANDFQVYLHIVLPLFKAGLATVGLFKVVENWNNWFTGVLYIENPKLVPIMTLLQKIQKDIEYLKSNTEFANSQEGMELMANLPSEACRMAISVIAILPLMVMYPFFQKYFVKGMTVGSVKG